MTKARERRLKICMAASGGGHLRQLLQMTEFAKRHDYYFLTEKTPLGASLARDHKTRFVPHFAFGQRSTEGWLKFIIAGIGNAIASLYHFIVERPQVIISTGAGAAFFTLILGWLFRRKVIYFESIARVDSLSLFGRLSARFAGRYYVQWPRLEVQHPKAIYCNPFRRLEAIEKPASGKVFATVGTVLPFDRMIDYIVSLKKEGILKGDIVAQIGESEQNFDGLICHKTMSQDALNDELQVASIAIVHGGSGSMLGAMRYGCHVIAVPREFALGEHYDDHQFELVGAFAEQGMVQQVHTLDEMRIAITEAESKKAPAVDINANAYTEAIEEYLRECDLLPR